MNKEEIKNLAKTLDSARLTAKPIEQLSNSLKFSQKEAYSIQLEGRELREIAGENIVGYKMGLTSEKKRQQMGLHSPVFGVLSDKMKIEDSNGFSTAELIHPKIEPEIAFLIAKDLSDNPSFEEVQNSIGAVYPALEILDSRYTKFKYFSLEDVIADNSSSSHFFLGEEVALSSISKNLADLSVSFLADGKEVAAGFGRDVSGHPFHSVQQQAALLKENNLPAIKAGTLILTGALTVAHPLEKSCLIEAKIEGLPSCQLKIESAL